MGFRIWETTDHCRDESKQRETCKSKYSNKLRKPHRSTNSRHSEWLHCVCRPIRDVDAKVPNKRSILQIEIQWTREYQMDFTATLLPSMHNRIHCKATKRKRKSTANHFRIHRSQPMTASFHPLDYCWPFGCWAMARRAKRNQKLRRFFWHRSSRGRTIMRFMLDGGVKIYVPRF